jgi:hypothetical protein
VHKVSQVGAEQARIELQVVISEWLGTADKLAVHLAPVSQVDHVPEHVDAFDSDKTTKEAIKGANGAERSWLALLAAGPWLFLLSHPILKSFLDPVAALRTP